MTRLVQIDVNYNVGSTGRIVRQISQRLGSAGFRVFPFYGRHSHFDDCDAQVVANPARVGTAADVYWHALATRVTGYTARFSAKPTRQLIAQIEHIQPSLVHLHDLHGYFIHIELLCSYLKQAQIPVVWTFHSDFMFTGRCGSSNECEGWRTGCLKCPHLDRYPQTWFFDRASAMLEQKKHIFYDFERLRLVAPSHWLAQKMKSSIVASHSIDVVPNGIDVQTFQPHSADRLKAQLGVQDRYCVISVGAGLMNEQKGGRLALALAQRCTDPDVVFMMVGVDDYRGEVPANVIIRPTVADPAELAQLYSVGDVLLLTSQTESFSMVTAEALACGLPVIGFDSGAPTEVAPAGYGRFVPYGDIEALLAVLMEVRSHGGGLKTPTECTEFARAHYASDSMVDAYAGIYKHMIEQYPRLL